MSNGNILRPIFHGDNRANKERSPSRLPSAETIRNAALGLGTLATLSTIGYAGYRHLKQRTPVQDLRQDLGAHDYVHGAIVPARALGAHDQDRDYPIAPSTRPHGPEDALTRELHYATAVQDLGAQSDAQYREIVPSTESNELTYTTLTHGEATALATPSKGGLVRSPNGFVWKPVKGKIIVCLPRMCAVIDTTVAMSSISGSVRTVVKTHLGDETQAPVMPVCAAMAVALNEGARIRENPYEISSATALSDEHGRWLEKPATCSMRSRSGMLCYPEERVEQTIEFHQIARTDELEFHQMTPREKAPHAKPIAEYRAIVPSGTFMRRDDPTLTFKLSQLPDEQRNLVTRILGSDVSEVHEGDQIITRQPDGLFKWMNGSQTNYIGAPEEGKLILCFPGQCAAYTIRTAEELLDELSAKYDTTNLRAVPTSVTGKRRTNESIVPEHATMALVMLRLLEPNPNTHSRVDAVTNATGKWARGALEFAGASPLSFSLEVDGGSVEQKLLLKPKGPAGVQVPKGHDASVPVALVAHGKPGALRVNQKGTSGLDWFQDMFNFLDDDPEKFASAKERFKYDAESGELTIAGAKGQFAALLSSITKWKAGHFTTPKLEDLRAQTKAFMKKGQTTVSFVTGDVAILHGTLEYAGAVFQAASQFNCLEFISPTSIPEMGVAIYEKDPTQGPACAIACAPGTIVRNYFAFDGKYAQTKECQINTLRDLIKYLTDRTLDAEEILVDVKNGYTDSDKGRLEKIQRTIGDMDDEGRDILMSQLMVGVQKDTQVTRTKTKTGKGAPWHGVQSGPADPPLLVTQVYASALAIAYTRAYHDLTGGKPKASQNPEVQRKLDAIEELWEPLARLVLDAAYEATLHAAVIHAWPDASGRRKVVLTALGGGVFANRPEWIASAIVRAIAKFKGAALDVVINEWNAGQLDYIKDALRANNETAPLVQPAKFGRDARASRLESARPIVMYTE